MLGPMTKLRSTIYAALILGSLTSPAFGVCYADYKAKMDDPLRLHYGVIEIADADCTLETAPAAITPRLTAAGWQLLEVMSLFDETGLEARHADAGQYYLAF